MNKGLKDSLELLEQEYNIDRETLTVLFEEALEATAKKCPKYTRNVKVTIDRSTYDITCNATLYVVEKVVNPADEIAYDEIHEKFPDKDLGDEVTITFPISTFGRITVQSAQQLFHQRVRQAQKQKVCAQFQDQLMQLVTGEVRRLDREGVVVGFQLGAASRSLNDAPRHMEDEGLLRKDEKIPGENFEVGDLVTALLIEVNPDRQGPAMLISRTHPEFIRKLFEREVTEIGDGIVEIKAVSRDAGYRSKIAVVSNDPHVDAVGACVGQRGMRVRTIVRELGGEKVDIIEWSPDIVTFVTNALKPSTLVNITADQEKKTVSVTVPKDQYSLAIGKRGQNVRLATKLTGWRIEITEQDVVSEEEAFASKVKEAIEKLSAVECIGPEAAEILVKNGFASLEGIAAAEVEVDDIANLEGLDHDRAAEIIKAAKAAIMQ